MRNLTALCSNESKIFILCTLEWSPTQFFLPCDPWFHHGLKCFFHYLSLLERKLEWALSPSPCSLWFALWKLKAFFVEIIFHKKKWLVNCSYNPHKNSIKNHLEIISRELDTFTTKYENMLLLGDFNACADDETMKNLCSSYGLHKLIKQQLSYKNPENLSCIDLILTNKAKSFESTWVMETGLSDFHRMTISVLKMHFRKLPPKVIRHRDFKHFENGRFMNSLQSALDNKKSDYVQNPDLFFNICHRY